MYRKKEILSSNCASEGARDAEVPPLCSFIIFAYKHERFVAEAVASAFRQDYSPLEIILSDDRSPDGTFEIMKEMSQAYCGPHVVVVNQNERNLGPALHINRCLAMARGRYIVMASGDDISLPARTRESVRALRDPNNPADLSCSYFAEISEIGKPTGFIKKSVVFTPDISMRVRDWRCGATGACATFRRELFDKYGPLDEQVIAEDWVFSFRAWLGGGIALVPEPLVWHRRHGESLSMKARSFNTLTDRKLRRAQRRLNQVGTLAIAKEWLKAWRIAKGHIDAKIENDLDRLVHLRSAQLAAFDGTWLNAIRQTLRVLQFGGPALACRTILRHVLRVY